MSVVAFRMDVSNPGLGVASTRNIPIANLTVGDFRGQSGLPGIFSRQNLIPVYNEWVYLGRLFGSKEYLHIDVTTEVFLYSCSN